MVTSVPTLSVMDYSLLEGDFGTVIYWARFQLSAPAGPGGVTWSFSTANGTALAGTDYEAMTRTVFLPEGQTATEIFARIYFDDLVEPDENFFINITSVTGATIGDGQAVITIRNDDFPPPPVLTINDVTITEGNSGTTSATFTVSLSAPANPGGVTFDIATADGSALGGLDYAARTLTSQTIAAGETQYTFTVDVTGETAFEANEAFFVNVTNVTGATVGDGQGIGTITNDDVAPPPPVLSINDVSVAEGDSGISIATFTVSLDAPAGPGGVTFDYNTSPGTASEDLPGRDFLPSGNSGVTIAEGETSRTISIIVSRDTDIEPDEQFFVNITNVTGATVGDGQGTATILNDDFGPPPTIRQTGTRFADNLLGTAGAIDIIAGNNGADTIDGLDQGDTLLGNGGNDELHGGEGDDTLLGGKHDDALFGDAGADRLSGEKGSDTLEGGAGADVFVFGKGFGSDTITDFEDGIDTIEFSTRVFHDFAEVQAASSQDGADVLIDAGGGSLLRIENMLLANLSDADFAFV